MPEVTSHQPGTPSWVDIGSPNIEESVAFYGGLFGWTAVDLGPEAGNYTMCQIDGKNVAAIGPAQNPGPPAWATYITVASVDDTAQKITDAGGTVVVPPMDVMDAGRMAVAQDPTGAFFSIWEPKNNIGASLVNEPGTLCWNELNTRDVPTALDFYEKVFGHNALRRDDYSELQLDGRSIAGVMPMPDVVPPEVPAHWMVYFAVDGTEAAVAKAEQLGGKVMVPPNDVPNVGRMALLFDPHGAVFSVITLEHPGS